MAVIPRGAGATGQTGPTGPAGAAGPNSVTSGTTTTNINGILYGNGAAVSTLNITSNFTLVGGFLDVIFPAQDATLTALAGLTITANSLTIGTGADAFSQTSFAANTFPARASTGNLEAKTITDAALSVLDDTTVAAMRTTLQITEPTAALVGSYDDFIYPGLGMGGRWLRCSWFPQVTTTIAYDGACTPSITGTLSNPGRTYSTLRSFHDRSVVTSPASAGSTSQIRTVLHQNQAYRGAASNMGGFFFKYTFAVETAVAGSRQLVGFRSGSNIASGTEPSSITNLLCIAYDSGDSNWQIMHNDGSGVATKVDLGANFPANTADTVFTVYFFCAPNSSTIQYEVRRRDVEASASGTLSTNLPDPTTYMSIFHWGDNNATAAAMILNMMRMDYWVRMQA